MGEGRGYPMAYTDFGLKVREILFKNGKTVTWLAEQLSLSVPYVSDILKGNRQPVDKINQIKKVLNME